MDYLLILGNDGELQRAEVEAVFGKNNIEKLDDWPIIRVKTENVSDFNTLGSTVRAGEIIGEFDNQEEVLLEIKKLVNQGVKSFGISGYGINSGTLFDWVKEIKREATEKVRFNIPQEGSILSSVAIVKKKITEFTVVENNGKYLLAKTIWVFDFESWGRRDFDKPGRNIKQGMLTPKAARMMLNLSAGGRVLDPFCGTGTILMEAAILKLEIVGNDIDKEQTELTKRNLEWMGIKDYSLFNTDATKISEKIEKNSIDSIVTEPYLGPLIEEGREPDEEKMKRIIDGLERMYIGCLHDWQNVLKKESRIVIIFPAFFIKNRVYHCEKPLDRCESLGYSVANGPYIYSHPKAIVKREIWVLKKI